MTEEDSGGTIKLIVLVIVILAFAWLMMTAYGKIKKYASGSVEQLGNKYIEPVPEASYCKSDYGNISTSKALREYIYYIDIGNCAASPLLEAVKTETTSEAGNKLGSPTLKNDVAIRCRAGQNTEEDYCRDIIFNLTRGGKADIHFNDMHYVDTPLCTMDPDCAPQNGRDLYICAQQKWQPSLLTYTEVSPIDKNLLLKTSPDMRLLIGRYGSNIILCVGNANAGFVDNLASAVAYTWELATNPAKLWDQIQLGWSTTMKVVGSWF